MERIEDSNILELDTNKTTLVNPVSQELNLQIKPFTRLKFNTVERSRYYSIIWVKQGRGKVKYELSEHFFLASSILFFVPFQPFVFTEGEDISGVILNFSSDFYCIEKHSKDVSCSGLLFSNVYDTPFIKVGKEKETDFDEIINSMNREFFKNHIPDPEFLRCYLKIFLIKATRIKKLQANVKDEQAGDIENNKLGKLKQLIEENFRMKKSPSDYASMMNIATKVLGKMVKEHFNKTLTQLIQERIITEAKRELFLTDKLVKEIAFDLGYEDSYYLSRLFKKLTNVSPEYFREHYYRA